MIIAIIFLLFMSLFFSGSETALTATNRMRLKSKANSGDVRAQKLLKLVEKPSVFITTILIGNNIANILLPTLVTTMAIDYGISVAIASAILTVVIIIFGEVIPKSVAAAFPERIAYLVRPIIQFLVVALRPITVILNAMTDSITRALSKGEVRSSSVSKDELMAIVDLADSEGELLSDESYRITATLNFQKLNVKDVMTTPRTEVIAVQKDTSFDDVRDLVISEMYTRYPVYDEDQDDIVGVFHSKYLLQWSLEPEKTLMDFADKDPLRVDEFESVNKVLRKMSRERKHLAIVIDEYGGTEGILTHEDIIESMLGFEIEDETDINNDSLVDSMTESEIVCDGKITLHRLNSVFGTEIPEEEDTLSGYLYKMFNDVPEDNDVHIEDELQFTVLQMEENTIRKVQILKR